MRRKTRFAVAVAVAAIMLFPLAALGTSAQNGSREWTVLMYFGADNDLYQATEFALNQAMQAMEDAEANGVEVSVVVLIDGPTGGDTAVYELTAGDPIVLTDDAFGNSNPESNTEKDMTDPGTLTSFLTWAMPLYEADKTMLVLKNGHAWCGICPDGTDNDGDEKILMPIDDVRVAIEDAYDSLGAGYRIDVIAFDGDNMGSIEVAYELRKVTDYFVGSQQQMPLEGLPYYLWLTHLVGSPGMTVEEASIQLVEDYVTYYNNTGGNKQEFEKLLSNSQMAVTGAVFRMGADGSLIEAAVGAFNNYLEYMLHGTLPQDVRDEAEAAVIDVDAKIAQWMYPDPTTGEDVWSWIPLSRNNISSARDCALIGKMNDQQGYEWLPDVYTWLWSMSALSNYDAYGDPIPPSGDVPPESIPPLEDLKDPFVRLLLEDFMEKWGYEEPGIYRGVWDANNMVDGGALVWVAQSQVLDRSGNSFPHGLNIWFPPSWLQWDADDEWSDLFNKPMTYAYWGIVYAYDGDDPVYLPAEYFCIDSPVDYVDIGLDFTDEDETSWMEFFGVYYDSRWLIYGPGEDTGGREDNKP